MPAIVMPVRAPQRASGALALGLHRIVKASEKAPPRASEVRIVVICIVYCSVVGTIASVGHPIGCPRLATVGYTG